MTKVFFYCDESGAKGYADQDEAFPGEVGIFAGIMILETDLKKVKPIFDEIAEKYTPASGKLHIADLPPQQQESLRNELFTAIKKTKLPCFWHAIHVAGFHKHHQTLAILFQQQRETMLAARGGEPPRIKQGSHRDNPDSMHEELFLGLYSYLIAYLEDQSQPEVEIQIRTDKVDSKLVKNFTELTRVLLNSQPNVTKVTGFDTIENKKIFGSLTTSVDWPSEFKLSIKANILPIEMMADSDGLVLAADVLANSLNHLFKKREDQQLYSPLNCKDAVTNHPLAVNLDIFNGWNGTDPSDALYSHPLTESAKV